MRLLLPLGLLLGLAASQGALAAQSADPLPVKDQHWSFEGPFGHYDRGELQRGFQVYKEVCSACHALTHVGFHALDEDGGPGFNEKQMKVIASGFKIPAGPNDKGDTVDDKGNPLMRPGTPADYFPPPFANEQAARAANGGALPPDLSMIVKARDGGSQYVYSIITGFHQTPPAGFKVLDGKYYNPYFGGWNISMPPPLSANQVTYADGTKATVEQEAHDVVTFLTWASDPKMEDRKRMGFEVMAFLIVLAGLLFLSYRKVWKDMH
jgi:ubiquinol-cytochrome c reductase cytochrome b/c1 subunit